MVCVVYMSWYDICEWICFNPTFTQIQSISPVCYPNHIHPMNVSPFPHLFSCAFSCIQWYFDHSQAGSPYDRAARSVRRCDFYNESGAYSSCYPINRCVPTILSFHSDHWSRRGRSRNVGLCSCMLKFAALACTTNWYWHAIINPKVSIKAAIFFRIVNAERALLTISDIHKQITETAGIDTFKECNGLSLPCSQYCCVLLYAVATLAGIIRYAMRRSSVTQASMCYIPVILL